MTQGSFMGARTRVFHLGLQQLQWCCSSAGFGEGPVRSWFLEWIPEECDICGDSGWQSPALAPCRPYVGCLRHGLRGPWDSGSRPVSLPLLQMTQLILAMLCSVQEHGHNCVTRSPRKELGGGGWGARCG